MASLAKKYTFDTHRAADPQETLDRVGPHLLRMGITRVANVTGLDRIGIPVVMVCRPNSRSVAVAQGKGLSLEAAKASGVMESVETWHAERISLPIRYACQADLVREAPIADVRRLPRVRASRFSETARILWIPGRELNTREEVWLPFEMVHTDFTRRTPPGHGFFPSSSNGLASGNHLLEATCHALCEVIERDATSVWHHLPSEAKRRTRIRPGTIDVPVCLDAMRRIEAAGLDLAVWDTCTDSGVAAFRCVIVETEGRSGHIGIGDGAHPHRGIALLRALTEAVQTRMTYISGARDDMTPDEFAPDAIDRKCRFARDLIDCGAPARDFAACPHHDADNFAEDLAWLLSRLEGCGIEQVVSVDLTRPEVGLPVVRVVVPGLEAPHDDDNYVPGPRALAAAEALP
ncbi:MAG TPA: YcaO-like family protein [Thermohalobaculum sp.]|nr:YcaO-like family protein [Thermohalobaculum sp.]